VNTYSLVSNPSSHEGERGRTCKFVPVPTAAEAAAGAGALMNRGKSILISPASADPTQASTTADDIVNVFIFSSFLFSARGINAG
jgi:hypothetical protein